jgi:hypothetical protein
MGYAGTGISAVPTLSALNNETSNASPRRKSLITCRAAGLYSIYRSSPGLECANRWRQGRMVVDVNVFTFVSNTLIWGEGLSRPREVKHMRIWDSAGCGESLVRGSCKHDNVPSGSLKSKGIMTGWATVSFLRKDSAWGYWTRKLIIYFNECSQYIIFRGLLWLTELLIRADSGNFGHSI